MQQLQKKTLLQQIFQYGTLEGAAFELFSTTARRHAEVPTKEQLEFSLPFFKIAKKQRSPC